MADSGRTALSVLARAPVFLALWLILADVKTADLPAAIAAVVAAVWVSLRLMSLGTLRVSPAGVLRLVCRFPLDAVVAGADVARRALTPHMSLQPGFVVCSSHQPPGPARAAFLMFANLLPGTVPCDARDDTKLLVHCVDVTQPIAAQTATDEARCTRAMRDG